MQINQNKVTTEKKLKYSFFSIFLKFLYDDNLKYYAQGGKND